MKLIFEVGDVVRLKSGSPAMTVDYIGIGPWGEDTVYAVWFEEGSDNHCSSEKSYGALQRGEFTHDSLDPVKTLSPIVEILKLANAEER